MEQKEITKTRLIIYVLLAYGLTCLMGILMWYGSTKGYDLTVFPTAQMRSEERRVGKECRSRWSPYH